MKHIKRMEELNESVERGDRVYVVIEAKSVDYHGRYDEIVDIYASEEDARAKVNELSSENHRADTEYFFDTYKVK